jgi:predicted nucleic acid-binding protein
MIKLSGIFFERILLDTNVLNSALTTSKGSEIQKQFLALALNNELNICDTVYYEFLRNCSLQTYRERVIKLDEIKPAIHHIRDNPGYFKTVWFLYLYALKNDPGKLLSIDLQDIHIASCAIYEKIDNILTANL